MTRQTAAPLTKTHFTATNLAAREIARMVLSGDMTIDAPYQRGEVWQEDQQVALVRSWLTGAPIPAIVVNNRMTASFVAANSGLWGGELGYAYSVVDGQQRVRAAVAWFEGDLAVPASWFSPEVVESTLDTDDGPYVRHRDLIRGERTHQAFTFMLPMAEGQLPTIQAEAEAYLLVNGAGTPQTDADMSNAKRVVDGGAA